MVGYTVFFAVLTVFFAIGGAAFLASPPAPTGRYGGGFWAGPAMCTLALLTGMIAASGAWSLTHRGAASSAAGPAKLATFMVVLGIAGAFIGLSGPAIGWVIAVISVITAVGQIKESRSARSTARGR